MKSTHCPFYIPVDRQNCDETKGGCLDQPKDVGVYYPCLDVIESDLCHKKRKSPVL